MNKINNEAGQRSAKQHYILNGPPPDTFSSRMPAFTYTVLCPVPELRKVLMRKGGDAGEIRNSGTDSQSSSVGGC